MAYNEETFFYYMLNDAVQVDGEDTVDLVVRIYTTFALDQQKFKNDEELDSFIEERFQERHRNVETEDINRIKNNMIKARRTNLYREISDINRAQKINGPDWQKEKYNTICSELLMIRDNPNTYFDLRFNKEKRRS